MSGVAEMILIAVVAGERVAMLASDIESVVELGLLVPVPRASPHVAGLAALRSRVLTVIDCYAALGIARRGEHVSKHSIIIEVDGHVYALLVDSVEDVVPIDAEVRTVRGRLTAGWRAVARGAIEVEDALLLMVEPAALLTPHVPQAA